MGRRKKLVKPEWIHDHFDGSAHCIECNGPCLLQGGELLATSLIRHLIEGAAAMGTSVPPMIEFTLSWQGIDYREWIERARLLNAERGPPRIHLPKPEKPKRGRPRKPTV